MMFFEKLAFLKKKTIKKVFQKNHCLNIQFEGRKWVLEGKIQFWVTSVLCFQFQKREENIEKRVFFKDAFLRRKKEVSEKWNFFKNLCFLYFPYIFGIWSIKQKWLEIEFYLLGPIFSAQFVHFSKDF